MKKIIVALIVLYSISVSFAQEEVVSTSSGKSWRAYATYSPWDMWLPGKYGLVGSYGDKARTYELGWQKASYGLDLIVDDIGSITDQRIHLTTRSFTWGNSFNFQYGLSYNSFIVNLGRSFVSSDVVEMKAIAAVWGVGNRWESDNGFSFRADWLKIFMPFYTLKKKDDAIDAATNSSDKEDLDKLVDSVSKIPTLTLIHLEIGYRF